MKNPILALLLGMSVVGNVLLGWGLAHDENQIADVNVRIAAANAARVQAFNDYRQRLIDLKAEHSIIFKDLQIPPPAQ